MSEEIKTTASETGTASGAQTESKTEPSEKTFTQEDIDKIVNDRIKRESKKWNEKLTEAQKMQTMNEDEKAEYRKKQYEQELQQREQEITKRELKMTAREALSEKGLPAELCEVLDYTDAEACTKSIAAVEKAFMSAVEDAVDKRIKQSAQTPKTGGSAELSGVEAAFYGLNPKLKSERK